MIKILVTGGCGYVGSKLVKQLLNNNYHVVHHSHPYIPWYNLPSVFELNKEKFLKSNDNYYYKNYFIVFKKYLLVKKEKLIHPYWNLQNRANPIRQEESN